MLDLVLFELPNLALESPTMYHPLGILYLASVAENAGYKVEIVDYRVGIKTDYPEARFYGFSCTTPEVNFAKKLAAEVKVDYPNAKTISGGPHPSLLPSDCVDSFDFVCIGEGEKALLDIMQNGGNGVAVGQRIKNLDVIPYPAWDKVKDPFSDNLFTGERYGKGEKSASLITSRGCPFNCHFCGNLFRTPLAFRTVENIEGELQQLLKRDIHYVRLVDDNFTIHPEFERLCFVLKRLGIKYRCHTRSDLLTKAKAHIMKDSGCEECSLGVESADGKVLLLNNKRETVLQHGKAVEILRQVGLRSKVYLMSGLPGETDNSSYLLKCFMREFKPDKWTLSTFTPYPGCEIYNNPRKFGITILNPNWSNWWNFVMPIKGKDLPGRTGYVHVLNGQTVEQMGARHDELYEWLKSEVWK